MSLFFKNIYWDLCHSFTSLNPRFQYVKKIAVSTENTIHAALNRWSMLRVKTASRIIGKPKKFDIVLQCNVSDLTGRLRQRCHQMQTLTRPLKYLEKKNLISNVCAAKRRRFLLYLSFAKRWLSILTTKFYTETHR